MNLKLQGKEHEQQLRQVTVKKRRFNFMKWWKEWHKIAR